MKRLMLLTAVAAAALFAGATVGANAQTIASRVTQCGAAAAVPFNAQAAADSADRYLTVTGAGNDTESDQSTADQNADSQAQTNLQNACPGTLTQSTKIYDVCSQIGSNYMCSVTYSGQCQISN